jgi:hypothetical protein
MDQDLAQHQLDAAPDHAPRRSRQAGRRGRGSVNVNEDQIRGVIRSVLEAELPKYLGQRAN